MVRTAASVILETIKMKSVVEISGKRSGNFGAIDASDCAGTSTSVDTIIDQL